MPSPARSIQRILPALLLAVAFALPLSACSSGESGDPGRDWEIVELPTKAEIWGIQFLDAQRGYLCGGSIFVDGGLVGRSVDGGVTWEFESGLAPKASGATISSFYDLFFLDDQRGFLVGHSGLLMRTHTGWKGFERVRSGPVYGHIRDLEFVDYEFGWAMGESGLLGTEDGGELWNWRGPEGEKRVDVNGRAMDFVDRERGTIAGRNGKLLRTFDAGRHWEKPKSVPVSEDGPHLFGLHFADADHGWAVGENGTIWHTGDGGARWTAQESGVRDFFMDVHFIDAKRGWVVGYDRELQRGVILGTKDGGATWQLEIELPGEEFYAIDALPSGEAWVVGKHLGQGGQRLLRRVPTVAAR